MQSKEKRVKFTNENLKVTNSNVRRWVTKDLKVREEQRMLLTRNNLTYCVTEIKFNTLINNK